MKDAIRDKVAVVGMGCCKFGENWDKAPEDMIVEAAYEAYQDAGIEDPQRQIEAIFVGSVYPSRGTAEVTIGDTINTVHENESIFIPIGSVHRLANQGRIPLELIEVQTGSYLGEDDIVRLDDVYKRM